MALLGLGSRRSPKAKGRAAKSKAKAIAYVKVKDEPEAKAEEKDRRPLSAVDIDAMEYVFKVNNLECAFTQILQHSGVDAR